MRILFQACTKEDGQETGNAVLNSDHLGAFWNRHFDMQHLREGEAGRSRVALRYFTHGEDGYIKLLAIGLEALNVSPKHECAKGSKSSPNIFVKGYVSKVGGHEVQQGKLIALFGKIALDANDCGVADLTCAEALGNCDKKKGT